MLCSAFHVYSPICTYFLNCGKNIWLAKKFFWVYGKTRMNFLANPIEIIKFTILTISKCTVQCVKYIHLVV